MPTGMMTDTLAILRQYWGYQEFLPRQAEIIASILDKKDTLALLPTGGGKSICYQVPALILDGICLVVTPLVALMQDQADQLKQRGIASLFIHSGMTWKEVNLALKEAVNGKAKFLYVSPERLQSGMFREYVQNMDISLLAVDEAHCISEWGYDFRPAYLKIASLRDILQPVPVLALTATATSLVVRDIQQKLLFSAPNVLRESFARKNMIYSVQHPEDKAEELFRILEENPGSSLVYCRSRKYCEKVAGILRQHQLRAEYYHAGLDAQQRHRRQQSWISNDTRIMVCTTAFGMGIDKPDVRTVIHYDVPGSLEAYYQQSGRAGRDGMGARAVLFWQTTELEELLRSIDNRFPPVETIRKVYRSLVNYLQLPAGSGEMLNYEMDLDYFSSTFGLYAPEVKQVLRILEMEGICAFSEKSFLPSRAVINSDRNTLEQFEKDHPELEQSIQFLLRNYPGIWDEYVPVREKQMAVKLFVSEEEIIRQLKWLDSFHIIDYLPHRDSPQLCFLKERGWTDDLEIDTQALRIRKETYALQVNAVLKYIREDTCRNQQLLRYFDEPDTEPCGICDICRKKGLGLPHIGSDSGNQAQDLSSTTS